MPGRGFRLTFGLLALAVASAGAVSAAGVLLVLALGFGLYAHHWLSLAGPAASAPARRMRSGARSRRFRRRGGVCVTRCPGGGVATSTRWRSGRWASRSWSRPRRGRTTIAISLECANRRRGCRGGVGGGVGAAPCRWFAWFAHVASSDLSRTFWCCRSISWCQCCEAASADSIEPPASLACADYSASWGGSMETMRRQPSSRNAWAESPSCRAKQVPARLRPDARADTKPGLAL